MRDVFSDKEVKDLEKNMEKKLAINYILDNLIIRRPQDLLRVLSSPHSPRQMNLAKIIRHNFVIPTINKPIPAIINFIYSGNKFFVIKDLGYIVENKRDLLKDWIQERKNLVKIFDHIYQRPFIRENLLNKDNLGLLEELKLVGKRKFISVHC